jgi:hypothetical protein
MTDKRMTDDEIAVAIEDSEDSDFLRLADGEDYCRVVYALKAERAILDEVAELPRQVAGDDVSQFIWCDELDAVLERK